MRPVNLIPQDQRRRTPREGSGRGAHAVLGVLAVLLAMAVVYVLSANSVTEKESQAEEARIEAEQLEAEVANKESFADFAEIAQTRAASVAAVASTRFDWERLMREVALIMPAGSWLQSADASVTGAAGADAAAEATVTTTSVGPVSPSATFVGCTPRQSDVARMMVRLRQMHRVADVTLKESTQEQASSPATVDNCGRFYRFDLTVSFNPTEPASATPRGATRVPASLGGGS